ncbi:MAG: hypothetical protein J6U00_10745, partial [Ruminococcus sp.]|uniref:hypothetical protein n=1 Tax=Ruminococcus sp. TaxID=41978 RepID=UPI001B0F4CE4
RIFRSSNSIRIEYINIMAARKDCHYILCIKSGILYHPSAGVPFSLRRYQRTSERYSSNTLGKRSTNNE